MGLAGGKWDGNSTFHVICVRRSFPIRSKGRRGARGLKLGINRLRKGEEENQQRGKKKGRKRRRAIRKGTSPPAH